MPSTNTDFWKEKFERNVERDAENEDALEELGWQVLIVWECNLNDDPVEAVEELMTELDAQLEE
ncbi:DNA mismatch endonuclease (patch repair protein) [Salinibacter ruber]|nr:DNA mismatch endonuclease (patch repair protein) [Salinibacter ruber]